MRIPTSPLLLTLALSSSTLAYPTPARNSPNPENSPLLGEAHADADLAWGARPDKMPGKLGRRWGRRQTPLVPQQVPGSPLNPGTASASGLLQPAAANGLSSQANGLLGGLGGLGLGSVGSTVTNTLGSTAGGLVGNLGGSINGLPVVGGVVGGLAGNNGQSALGGLTGTLNGLPVVGGVVGGLSGTVNGLPVVGGVVSGLGGSGGQAAIGGLTGTLNGLPVVGGVVGGLGGTVNGLPVVGGLAGGLLNQQTQGNLQGPIGQVPVAGGLVNQQSPGNLQGQVGSAAHGINTANIGSVPTLVANLGEGKYLTSAGQILNLGGLGNLPIAGGLVSGLTGSATGAVGGAGQVSSTIDNTPVKYLNLNGQLLPVNAAGQVISSGPENLMHFAADPAGDDASNMPTPPEAFASNSTAPTSEEGYNNPYPEYSSNSDALQLVAGTMGGSPDDMIDAAGKPFPHQREGWEKWPSMSGGLPSASATMTGATRSGTASASVSASTVSTTTWSSATPTPTDGWDEGDFSDEAWGEWVSGQPEPTASA